ncbi:putative polyketide synthase [Zymoseptoria tritici IPO323]|uniref:Polyketide synthase n=1 Tax=Zymoseptoria tritici (strain CBS 115943 / IPO323) TaxID=336722 RepID=F9X218_ZYMTI|nr:putative polyketide synthase [Zymoseptoria tritici IPO323]EGP90777.1 putative polyketide synthase [Zymoseptoria tritici IPO323]
MRCPSMACRFAAGATSPSKLWEMLGAARTGWGIVPDSRFNAAAFHHPHGEKTSTANVTSGHFLEQDIAHFDHNFFGLSAEVAKSMDPQQRMTLEVVYEALENAGITLAQIAGSNTSVFAGIMQRDYSDGLLRDPDRLPQMYMTTNAAAMASNRVSHFYDLRGPSMTIDTACSTTLTAVHLACKSLQSGESVTSIVTGANLMLNPDFFVTMSSLGFLSPDGKSYAFDKRANGYGRGEGIASIVLKRLGDAIEANDHIHAVICTTGLNQDGKTATITRPSCDAQQALIAKCYKQAGLDMKDTGYVEAHGTGTKTGDPIELEAIARTIGVARASNSLPLWLGSVKTNVGHCEAASGLASIIKTALCLKRGVIPPNADFGEMSEACRQVAGHITIPRKCTTWPEQDRIRRASVNNFGFGGANAHVIMEQAPEYAGQKGETHSRSGTRPRLFALSSHNEEALSRTASQLRLYLTQLQGKDNQCSEAILDDLAYTLHRRRSRFSCIDAVSASSITELDQHLERIERSCICPRRNGALRIGFVFNGQGAQWQGMGKELIATYPAFRASIQAMDGYMREMGAQWSYLNDVAYSLPLSTAIQVALTDLLRSWNVFPAVVTGHSSGEVAAAYAAHAIDARSAIAMMFIRGSLAAEDDAGQRRGAMLAVGLSQSDVLPYVAAVNGKECGRVWVACVNSPKSVTASGDIGGIAFLEQLLNADGAFCRRLKVTAAFHTEYMAPISSRFMERVRPWLAAAAACTNGMEPAVGREPVAFCSSVTGTYLTDLRELATPEYWNTNMLSQVQFDRALSKMCIVNGRRLNIDMIVEVGPHSALKGPIMDILKEANVPGDLGDIGYGSCLVRKRDAVLSIHGLVGELVRRGHGTINLDLVNFPTSLRQPGFLLDLPSYPWSHEVSFWIEEQRNKSYRHRTAASCDLLGVRESIAEPMAMSWSNFLKISDVPWLRHHVVGGKIVFPAAGYLCMAIDAIGQMQTQQDGETNGLEYHLRNIAFPHALVLPEDEGAGCQLHFHLQACPDWDLQSHGWFQFHIYSREPKSSGRDVWRLHCSGQTKMQVSDGIVRSGEQIAAGIASTAASHSSLALSDTKAMDPQDLWATLRRVGIEYGAAFRNFRRIIYGDSNSSTVACVELHVADTASTMPRGHESAYAMHPTTIDAVLQAAYPSYYNSPLATQEQAYLPPKRNGFSVDMTVHNANPNDKGYDQLPVLEVTGLEFHGAPVADSRPLGLESRAEDHDRFARTFWTPDVRFGVPEHMLRELRHRQDSYEESLANDLHSAALHYMSNALETIPSAVLGEIPGHFVKYHQWMKAQIEKESATPLSPDDLADFYQRVGSSGVNGELMTRVGPKISAIIQGHESALDLMMQDRLLYRYYENAPQWRRSETQLASLLHMLTKVNPKCSILEIGAGTGGATKAIMQASPSRNKWTSIEKDDGHDALDFSTYHFTDISPAFFDSARQQFSPWAERMLFKQLDISSDPLEQGFEPNTYDVVVACQVLHATSNIRQAMLNVHRLLKPDGKLLLMETTRDSIDIFLAFGLLPGWWLSTEPERASSPSLSLESWDLVLRETGFSGVDCHLRDHEDEERSHFSVLMSTARRPNSKLGIELNGTCRSPLHVVARDFTCFPLGWLQKLDDTLTTTLGVQPMFCSLDRCSSLTGMGCSVIYIEEPGSNALSRPTDADYNALKSLLTSCQSVFWITRGAVMDVVDPWSSLIHGLLRSLRCEYPSSNYVTLDLDPRRPFWTFDSAKAIAQVYASTMQDPDSSARDFEFCERHGVIHVPRLRRVSSLPSEDDSTRLELRAFTDAEKPIQLEIRVPGLLDTLEFLPAESREHTLLPPDMVEIAPRAFGLNFRHIMLAMGELPCDQLPALECSGVITRLGAHAAVNGLRVGDRVCAFSTDSWRTSLWTPWTSVAKIPDQMSWVQAASIPVAFSTAYVSLVRAARVQRGETVLVHAAAGGLGQAAVSLCQHLGAEVYATVGSERKRKALIDRFGIRPERIFSSRSQGFVDGLMQATKGRGVDVVINSLSGPLLQSGLNCLARFGRFVELGRRDIENHHRIDFAAFGRSISVLAVDLLVLVEHQSREMHKVLETCVRLVGHGTLPGIEPIVGVPLAGVEQGFRQLQTGQHIGKVVVNTEDGNGTVAVRHASPRVELLPDASYLVVGGGGGIGKKTCEWLAKRGARSLIVLSRNTPEGTGSWDSIPKECHIRDVACDVSDRSKLEAALATCDDMPPIRGVIHAGMVLHNSAFENMTRAQYMAAIYPKVMGSWNLHQVFPAVDFFVMCSSVLGITGAPGQVNYTAGCSFQDALARLRTSRGMSAVSLNLGMVESVGYVAENNLFDLLKERGLEPIPIETVLRLMELAISQQPKPFDHIVCGINADPGTHWARDFLLCDERFSTLQDQAMSSSSAPESGFLQQPANFGRKTDRLSSRLRSSVAVDDASKLIVDELNLKLQTMFGATHIDTSKDFSECGVDSLVAIELRNWLRTQTGLDISVTGMMQACSIDDFAHEVAERMSCSSSDD